MKRTVSALAAAGLCLLSLPASAQVWLGQIAGQMAADQGNAQLEFNCRHATPLGPDAAKPGKERVRKAMAAYLALTPSATPKDIAAVFESDVPDSRWAEGDQKVPLDKLAAHLSPPAESPQLITVVMGGDGATTRTIWSGKDAAGPVFYAVDFTNGTWFRNAHIIDMLVSHAASPPDTPPAYCHMDGRFVAD